MLIEVRRLEANLIYVNFLIYIIFGNIFYDLVNLNFIDEINVLIFVLVLLLHIIAFNNFRIDLELLLGIFILAFYVIYSYVISVTKFEAVLVDSFQQAKPFITYFTILIISPQFSNIQVKILNFTILVLAGTILLVILSGNILSLFSHYTNLASASLTLALFYYYFNYQKFSGRLLSVLILILGLFSLRSKFYGEFIFSIIVLVFVHSKIKFSFKYLILGLFVISIIIYVTWAKFNFYFIEGVESEDIARPVMYKNAFNIMLDYFPFGPGLGTYGNEASRLFYSPLYYEYNMNKIWGMSPDFDRFVADTFFPNIAQFGIFGLILLGIFYIRVLKRVQEISQINLQYYKIGLIIVTSLFIESVADTTVLSNRGIGLIFLLGLISSVRKSSSNHIL